MNPLQVIFFDFYGYTVNILSSDFDLSVFKTRIHFNYFTVDNLTKVDLSIHLTSKGSTEKEGVYLGKTKMCEVRQVGFSKRNFYYESKNKSYCILKESFKDKLRFAKIICDDLSLAEDILYFYINSAVGEYWDYQGLMRVHALSFRLDKESILVYGNPGSGKSTLAKQLLSKPDIRIYSDEISLIDLKTMCLLPCPVPISLADDLLEKKKLAKFNYFFGDKKMLPIPAERVASKDRLNAVFLFSQPKIKTTKFTVLFLILTGFGLIQMTEFLLRFNNMFILLKIFFNRIKLAKKLKTFKFNKIDDRKNALVTVTFNKF